MNLKPVEWIASTLADLKTFPSEVQNEFGHALYRVQSGETPENAKPLHGPLRHVLEMVENDPSGTYRLVYTVKIGDVVYVLHAFQKKSHRKSTTPKNELDLIAQRLRKARIDYEQRTHR
jgi:phage-related protein